MPIRDTNLLPSIVQGQQAGQRNFLLEKELRDEQQRNRLIADYTMEGATPEARDQALNRLMTSDPQAAQQVVTAQAAIGEQRRAQQEQQMMADAREQYEDSSFVLESPNPHIALSTLDTDGSLRQQAVGMGFEWPEGGLPDPESARTIAGLLQAQAGRVIDVEQPRAAGLEGTFQALERRGVDVTPEMAMELAQSSDSEVAALAAELGVQKSILDLERTRFELAQKAADAKREGRERDAQNAANERRALGGAERILQGWEALDTISQSAVARPGFAGEQRSTLASALSFIGMEDPQVASAAEQFQDVATISGAELITELGLDPTDTKFRAITEASLSLDKGEQTNRVQLQRLGRTVLDEADAGRINLPEDVESRFREIVEWEPQSREPTIDAPGAARRAGEAVSGAASRVSEAGRELFGSAKSTLSDVATRARTTGGRVSADMIRETSAQIDALRDQLPEPDFNRAKELVESGTEEGMLAARGILDSAQETAGGAAVRIEEIARMGIDRLEQLDRSQMSEEALEAARRRWEEVSGGER